MALQKTVRKYISVFAALMALTALTVGISTMHVGIGLAVTLAMIIAIIKGSLVASFFMHLLSEQKIIFLLLIFTVIFFFGMLLLMMAAQSQEVLIH